MDVLDNSEPDRHRSNNAPWTHPCWPPVVSCITGFTRWYKVGPYRFLRGPKHQRSQKIWIHVFWRWIQVPLKNLNTTSNKDTHQSTWPNPSVFFLGPRYIFQHIQLTSIWPFTLIRQGEQSWPNLAGVVGVVFFRFEALWISPRIQPSSTTAIGNVREPGLEAGWGCQIVLLRKSNEKHNKGDS